MDEQLQKFIKHNIELIENNNFEKLYSLAVTDLDRVSQLTSILYEAGIDPLQHMDHIPRYFYERYNIKQFTIPDNIKWIERSAFLMSSLKSITIPDNVQILHVNVFQGCFDLKELKIDKQSSLLVNIASGCFEDCIYLEEVELPDSLHLIGDSAFAGCDELKSVSIGSNVRSIGGHAFVNCPSLKQILFRGTYEQWKQIDSEFAFPQNPNGNSGIELVCSDYTTLI